MKGNDQIEPTTAEKTPKLTITHLHIVDYFLHEKTTISFAHLIKFRKIYYFIK